MDAITPSDWISKSNIARRFQIIKNRNPILTCGFHTYVFTVVFGQPSL
jgi:hypothetical protein